MTTANQRRCLNPSCQACAEEADEAQLVRLSAERALAARPVKRQRVECLASPDGKHHSRDDWWCDWCSEEI